MVCYQTREIDSATDGGSGQSKGKTNRTYSLREPQYDVEPFADAHPTNNGMLIFSNVMQLYFVQIQLAPTTDPLASRFLFSPEFPVPGRRAPSSARTRPLYVHIETLYMYILAQSEGLNWNELFLHAFFPLVSLVSIESRWESPRTIRWDVAMTLVDFDR